MGDGATYPIQNGASVGVSELISNFIPFFTDPVTTYHYLPILGLKSNHISKKGP